MPTENIINCESIFSLLSVYVDGEATPEEAFRVERHVDGCKACGSHLAFLRATSFVLTGIPDPVPDAALFARIASATYAKPSLREQIAEKVGVWLRPLPVRYAVGSAFAVALAAIVVVPRFVAQQPSLATSPPSVESVEAANAGSSAAPSVPSAGISTSGSVASRNGNTGGAETQAIGDAPPLRSGKTVVARKNAAKAVKPRGTGGGVQVADKNTPGNAPDKKTTQNGNSKATRRAQIASFTPKASGGKVVKTASVPKSVAPAATVRKNVTKPPQIASLSPAELRRKTDIFRPQVTLPYRHTSPRITPEENRIASLPESSAAAVAATGTAHLEKPAPKPTAPETTSVAIAAPATSRRGGYRVQGGNVRNRIRVQTLNIAASAKEQSQGRDGFLTFVSADIN